jgi:hypothetical protein
MRTGEAERQELLGLDYKTTFDTWHQLVDIRFKLLALIPVATVLGVSQRLPVAASLAGFSFVIGLVVYEIRNTQIHDALAKRLVFDEHAIGERVPSEDLAKPLTFSGRPPPSLRLFWAFKVWHNRAIAIVYGTSCAAWAWRFTASVQIERISYPFGDLLALIVPLAVGILVYSEIIRLSNKGRT